MIGHITKGIFKKVTIGSGGENVMEETGDQKSEWDRRGRERMIKSNQHAVSSGCTWRNLCCEIMR